MPSPVVRNLEKSSAHMTTRSMEEMADEYGTHMGKDLGAAVWKLHRRLIDLHIIWQQYRQLFGTDSDTVALLNRTAGLLFKVMQDQLWDSVLLAISRMTDPAEMGKKKNLTIHSLVDLIPDIALRGEIELLCAATVAEAEFAREHRNKRIAHQDHNYAYDPAANPLNPISRERVEAMLKALRAVLNRLNSHYMDTTVMYEDFIDESGARVLIHKLRKLERLSMVNVTGATQDVPGSASRPRI